MDGAFGRDRNSGEPADEALADFAGAPAGVLALHVQDKIFHLKGKLVGVAIGATTAVGQALHTAVLIAVEDLVAGLAGDAKFPAKFSHRLAGKPPRHKLKSLSHHRTLLPRHHFLPKRGKSVTHVSGTICYLCLRPLIQSLTILPILRIEPLVRLLWVPRLKY